MAFAEKQINVSISLANGQFDGGGNSSNLTGLRISCQINKPGGQSQGSMQMAIYGLSLSDMNKLTTTGTQQNLAYKNTISVQAGDDVVGMSTVFSGIMTVAYMDAQAMPEVSFQITAQTAGLDAIRPKPSTSIKGAGDVATIIGGLAGQLGYAFENNNVNVKLSNPYYSGSGYTQIMECAEDAGIEFVLDCGTLAIWNPGQPRQGAPLLISPETGLVGYPAFNQSGVIITTLFQPGIVYGGAIQVQSSITAACGTWYVHLVDLYLESQTPKGKWFAVLTASSVQTTGPS